MDAGFLTSMAVAGALAAGTLVSEDLTCITAGTLVAENRLGFAVAVAGCFAGILGGDLLIFLAGRLLGRRVVALPLLNRIFTEAAMERSSSWLRERGAAAVLSTRLVPGTRLPTYAAAGILRTNGWRFAAYLTLAAAIWTPLVIGISAMAGAHAIEAGIVSGRNVLVRVGMLAVSLAVVVKLASLLLTWRGRRRLFARWQRLTRWEFWPAYLSYLPLIGYILVLMIRHRSMTVFTAANPGMVGGGFIGESKSEILRALGGAGDRIADAVLIHGHLPLDERLAAAQRFIDATESSWPVVLKPDKGQRGSGVVIVRTPEALAAHVSAAPVDLLVQEYAPGHEFGVFYCRRPSETRGRIFSVTEKRFPSVVGDGRRTLEDLILADDRAVCLEHVHRRVHRAHLGGVPAAGQRVQLVEIGSHCRGAQFLDAGTLVTPALEAAFDAIAAQFDGFYFGRFDVRTPSIAEFRQGRSFKIVELNGVTSEATHIYDPRNGVSMAYRVLAAQWRLAFEIGAENRRLGVIPTPISDLVALIREYGRTSRLHPRPIASAAPSSVNATTPASTRRAWRSHVTRAGAESSDSCSGLLASSPEIPT